MKPYLNPTNLLAALLLPAAPAAAEWQPVAGRMLTEWGANLDPSDVWQEYPRPQLVRDNWTNLNGLWSYAIVDGISEPSEWDGEILVPFAPEAALSGVGKLLDPSQSLWYKRDLPAASDQRTLLHFEAVDHETKVWVNGREIGSHTGGHTPFSFDITGALEDDGNELLVRVYDATEGFQLHGKQKLEPGGIWYTRVSGIWQTVWLEQVPESYIEDLDFSVDLAAGTLAVTAKLNDGDHNGRVRVSAAFDGEVVATGTGEGTVMLELPDPKLWSPDDPNLYDLNIELLGGGDEVIDRVESYAAMREFGKTRDAGGNLRFTLNGEPIFHWGPLDQGWWPDGLLTPPSDEAMRSDVDYLKAAGFNMIRKHIKVEPRRYYAYCDKVGMLMWQDHVSMGYGPGTRPSGSNPPWTRLAPDPEEGIWPAASQEQFVVEYKRMVDTLRDHPCIAVWIPFNEAWGQHNTMAVGRLAVDYDRTRPINIASGGNFHPVGDIADEHAYPHPAFPVNNERFDDYIKVVGEFGGHGWPVEGHLWDEERDNWGYGGLPQSLDEWKERYVESIDILIGLRKRGVAAGVYTQTSDVEVEINGLLTYDRIEKIDPAWLKEQSDRLLAAPDVVELKVLVATSRDEPQQWSYTMDAPAAGWMEADFDDSNWQRGSGGFGTETTPGAAVGTEWSGDDIWIRREFEFTGDVEGSLVLRIFHDEDTQVYLNGEKIAELSGFVTGYVDVPLPDEVELLEGRNVLALHCHQTQGGQFIDAGLIDEIPAE